MFYINTDSKKLEFILSNLLSNAIKYCEKGSISLGYEKKEGTLEFFVKDTCIGISQEHQKVICERFRQDNDTLTNGYDGLGLGLSISKAYVEMLDGKIWVKSKEGNGSTFFFTIPC